MAATYKWVNKIDNPTLVTLSLANEYYKFPNHGDVPDTNPIHQHIEKIKLAIERNDAVNLKTLLVCDLQCSAVEDSIDYSLDEKGQETPAQYSIKARPFVEGLMLLNKRNLADLVTLIANQDNAALTAAFMDSLNQTDLVKSELFNWTETHRRKANAGINNLRVYGIELANQGILKGKNIQTLCDNLSSEIPHVDFHTHQDIIPHPAGFDQQQNHQRSLRTLQFKLLFCVLLHSQDKSFNQQRDYQKLICGIVASVCSLFVLNVENYIRTGSFLFFNKTETQSRIGQIDEVVSPHQFTL
jgi:hypothetical protein